MTTAVDDFFAHHGIKGMKWGVRRSNPSHVSSGGKSHAKNMANVSEDAAKANAAKAKIKTSGGTHTLSNQELQHLVNRMNLEQQYSRLSTQAGRKNAGSKFAKEILLNVAKQQVTGLASKAATKAVASALS